MRKRKRRKGGREARKSKIWVGIKASCFLLNSVFLHKICHKILIMEEEKNTKKRNEPSPIWEPPSFTTIIGASSSGNCQFEKSR